MRREWGITLYFPKQRELKELTFWIHISNRTSWKLYKSSYPGNFSYSWGWFSLQLYTVDEA